MKKSDVKKWIKALRSGEYKQTRMALCDVEKIDGTTAYCCIGVACDLFVDDYWRLVPHRYSGNGGEWSIGKFNKWRTVWSIGECSNLEVIDTTVLPSQDMMDSMGLDIEYVKDLADLNDQGWSFKKIADKIERDLLGEDE